MTVNVEARHGDLFEEAEALPPGTIQFEAADAGLFYNCPCGCGRFGYLPFRGSQPERPSWEWDGSREKPTLTPSVHDLVCGWHGWLRAGIWVSC